MVNLQMADQQMADLQMVIQDMLLFNVIFVSSSRNCYSRATWNKHVYNIFISMSIFYDCNTNYIACIKDERTSYVSFSPVDY